MRHAWAIGLVAVFAAVAVGCSKNESGERRVPAQPAAAPSPDKAARAGEADLPAGAVKEPAIDACTLVSKAEVEAVTNGKVSDPVAAPTGNMSQCTFGDPEGNAPLGRVKLIALNAGGPAAAKSIYELEAKDATQKREAVQGVGEAASLKTTSMRPTSSSSRGRTRSRSTSIWPTSLSSVIPTPSVRPRSRSRRRPSPSCLDRSASGARRRSQAPSYASAIGNAASGRSRARARASRRSKGTAAGSSAQSRSARPALATANPPATVCPSPPRPPCRVRRSSCRPSTRRR